MDIKPEHLLTLKEKQVPFFRVSAKTGAGVTEAILDITKEMITIHPKISEEKLSSTLQQSTGNRMISRSRCCKNN